MLFIYLFFLFKIDSLNPAQILPDRARLWDSQSRWVFQPGNYSAILDSFLHRIPFHNYPKFIRVKIGDDQKQNQKSCGLTWPFFGEKKKKKKTCSKISEQTQPFPTKMTCREYVTVPHTMKINFPRWPVGKVSCYKSVAFHPSVCTSGELDILDLMWAHWN